MIKPLEQFVDKDIMHMFVVLDSVNNYSSLAYINACGTAFNSCLNNMRNSDYVRNLTYQIDWLLVKNEYKKDWDKSKQLRKSLLEYDALGFLYTIRELLR